MLQKTSMEGEVKQKGQFQEAPRPPHKGGKTVQATLKGFMSSGGGSSESDVLARVMLEKVDKTKGRNKVVKTKYYHPHFPEYLPMHVVPLFLPPELAAALKAELVEEAKTMVSRKRRIGGRVIQPSRLTKVVHNEEEEDPINHKPAFAEATRLMEEYINRKKGEWGESTDEHWKPNFKVINVYRDRHDSLAAHSDTLAIIGHHPLIAGLNLGATRVFRLNLYRPADDPRKSLLDPSFDYDFHIPHNCAYIMLPGCQEEFKHSVPDQEKQLFPIHDGSEARYSITYRYQRWPIAAVPKCDHGNPANLHVVHRGNEVGSYRWRCDWTNANNEGDSCKFRMAYTGDPRGAKGGKQGGGGGGKVLTPQSREAGGALEVEGGEGEDRKMSQQEQEHEQQQQEQEEEEDQQQGEEEEHREQKAVEIVMVEDDVDEEGEEEQQQEEQPARAPERHAEVIVIDDDDDDE